MIQLHGIGKSYIARDGRTVSALSNLSFQCLPGEFVSILGPTGCGKTTLLRLLAGLERPNEGIVTIGGEPLAGLNRKAGLVFQQSALFPWLRALDNVAFPLRMQGISRKQRQAEALQWLHRLGLDGFAQAYPYELSGGMVQRVALARALIAKPALLLMDEPFSALDESTRYSLQDVLLKLWRETQATVLFVTHNVEEAVYLAGRIHVMTPPPGMLSEALPIASPHPRDRLSEAFIADLLQVRRAFELTVRGEYRGSGSSV